MPGLIYRWNGPQLVGLVEAEQRRRLQAAAIVVRNRAHELLSVEGTAKREKGRTFTRAGVKKVKRKGSLVYGANPSQPGESPHKQTGRLLGSVAWEVSGVLARVGTNLKYGRWLELGTTKMAARPWLRRALLEMRGAVTRLLTRPMKTP